jgi:putative flippase GtrA
MNITKHVIDKKNPCKRFFNVKWTFKDKNLQQSHHLTIYIYGKFQCTSLINSSFDDSLFFNFCFDTTLT